MKTSKLVESWIETNNTHAYSHKLGMESEIQCSVRYHVSGVVGFRLDKKIIQKIIQCVIAFCRASEEEEGFKRPRTYEKWRNNLKVGRKWNKKKKLFEKDSSSSFV